MTYEIFGEPDPGAVAQLERCMQDERALEGALMADHHLGYSMPIGGVIAYEGAISPSGVGYDIACGNKAVKTNLALEEIGEVEPIMREIQSKIEFGVGRKNPAPHDHDLFDDVTWPHLEVFSPGLKDKARAQLGTVGSGNHYVDLLVDDKGMLWVANHFGSRGLGHTIATGFLNLAANKKFSERGKDAEEPTVLEMWTEIGAFYISAMLLAGKYAYAGRDYVISQVLSILGAEATFEVHNHHNFAWYEGGRWVVRKGATPLTGNPAFIGGSMGDVSVIVRGRLLSDEFPGMYEHLTQNVEDIGAIGSAPHGAGRAMSRTKAAGKFKKFWACSNRDCNIKTQNVSGKGKPESCECGNEKLRKMRARDDSGAIDWPGTLAHLKGRGIVVLGAGADEAPGVYKDLETVIAAHPNIEILERLRPVGVVMAGEDTFDPYKD